MRVRRGEVVGWAVVAGYVALMAWASVAAMDRPPADRPAAVDAVVDAAAADRFAQAWQRSREGTYVATGSYVRRSEVTGTSLTGEDVVAQRPPRRLHRQMGGVEGRDDDRLLVCPAPPAGEEDRPAPCTLAPPSGPSYARDVADEVAALRAMTGGDQPLYAVSEPRPGCFALRQLRIEPRAPFGVRASFCFDPATGAVTMSRVRHEGGTVEVVVVTSIRSTVTDADLTP